MAPKTVSIKCKLRRPGGTKVDLFGKVYHFAPSNPADPDSAHVCDVPFDDSKAIYRLLQISAGYELVDSDAELPAKPKADPGQTIGNQKKAEEEIKPIIIQGGDGVEINLTALEPEELRKLAKDEFQIAVHHKWTDATVIAKIIEKTRGEN
jgi:hypothetical protein